MYSLLETLVSDSLFQYPLLYAGYSITDSCAIYGVLLVVPFANYCKGSGGEISADLQRGVEMGTRSPPITV